MASHDINEPRPWSGKRWFIEILYREALIDWPNSDKDYLFTGSRIKCEEAWEVMTNKQKERFNRYAEIDRIQSRSVEAAKKADNQHDIETEQQQKNPKQQLAPKKKPDPNKPKKLTAYMLFTKAKRQMLAEANPDFTSVELFKEIGQLWSKATPEEKRPFEEQAKKESEEYDLKMKAYKAKQIHQ